MGDEIDFRFALPSYPASVALLIDGENLSAENAATATKIAEGAGALRVRRVYGNLPKCNQWAATPGFRFFHPGTSKNSADMLLTVDAMELACTGVCDVFVIASSDGDFVHVADRLRERGHIVIGIGQPKTPDKFQSACTSFRMLPDKGVQNGHRPKKMDLLIRSEIAQHSNGGEGIPVCKLSNLMFKVHDIRISQMPEKTWRGYLGNRPHLYDLDPRGPDNKVRFLKSGFGDL